MMVPRRFSARGKACSVNPGELDWRLAPNGGITRGSPRIPRLLGARVQRHIDCVFENAGAARNSAPAFHAQEMHMNTDVVAGRWKELKGKVKEQWGKLTDDDLDRAEGRADQMIGLLQRHYGYARDKAEQEYSAFLDQNPSTPPAGKRI
jgi:uncharacterized protein YjbJ (UPF0337 family)